MAGTELAAAAVSGSASAAFSATLWASVSSTSEKACSDAFERALSVSSTGFCSFPPSVIRFVLYFSVWSFELLLFFVLLPVLYFVVLV